MTPEGFKVRLGAHKNKGCRMLIIHQVSAQDYGKLTSGETLRSIQEQERDEYVET